MTPCGACGAFPQGTTLALGETPSAAFPNGPLCDLLYFVTANADSFNA